MEICTEQTGEGRSMFDVGEGHLTSHYAFQRRALVNFPSNGFIWPILIGSYRGTEAQFWASFFIYFPFFHFFFLFSGRGRRKSRFSLTVFYESCMLGCVDATRVFRLVSCICWVWFFSFTYRFYCSRLNWTDVGLLMEGQGLLQENIVDIIITIKFVEKIQSNIFIRFYNIRTISCKKF